MKDFYWMYIISHYSAEFSQENDYESRTRIVDIVVEPAAIQRNKNAKKLYKIFTFNENEFLSKCSEFLEIKPIPPKSFQTTCYYFKSELARKISKLIIAQGDIIKLNSEFQKVEEEDDAFAKASVFFPQLKKTTFQKFISDNSTVVKTNNDSLFEKNFEGVYSKHSNQTQRYIEYKEENDYGVSKLSMDAPEHNLVFKQNYIEDEEVLVTDNMKQEMDLPESMLLNIDNNSPSRYYFKYQHQGTLCYIRLTCDSDLSGKNYIHISYYHPNREQINYATITDKKLLVSIFINLLLHF